MTKTDLLQNPTMIRCYGPVHRAKINKETCIYMIHTITLFCISEAQKKRKRNNRFKNTIMLCLINTRIFVQCFTIITALNPVQQA